MKNVLLATTVALFALSTAAFAADESYKSETAIKKDDKGNYSETDKTSKTDMAGTSTSVDKKVAVDVDHKGNTTKTVKTKTTTDPKGLFNKQTVKTKDTEKMKSDGTVATKHKKTVNGKTVEDTETK